MKPEIAKLWVEKLRSGTVEQAYRRLGSGDARCCLGVLCDLAVEAGAIPPPERSGELLYWDGEDEFLSVKVQEWAGVANRRGAFLGVNGVVALSELNDIGTTFGKIADLIEAHQGEL